MQKTQYPKEQFPSLFQGLGKLEQPYTIQLQEDTRPFALSTLCRVAIPLLQPVQQELERMERIGVISRVNRPTDWCPGMVVVPKASGKVCICVDLAKLNESVKRERSIQYLPSSRPWYSWHEQSSSPNLTPTRGSGKYPLNQLHPFYQPSPHPLATTASIAYHSASHQRQSTSCGGCPKC